MAKLNQVLKENGKGPVIIKGSLTIFYILKYKDYRISNFTVPDADWFIREINEKTNIAIEKYALENGFKLKFNTWLKQYEQEGKEKIDLNVFKIGYIDSEDPFFFSQLGMSFTERGEPTFYLGNTKIENLKNVFNNLKTLLEIKELPNPNEFKRIINFFPRLVKYAIKFNDLKDSFGENFKKALLDENWQYVYFTQALKYLNLKFQIKAPFIFREITRLIKENITSSYAQTIVKQFLYAFASKLSISKEKAESNINELILKWNVTPPTAEHIGAEILSSLQPLVTYREKSYSPTLYSAQNNSSNLNSVVSPASKIIPQGLAS